MKSLFKSYSNSLGAKGSKGVMSVKGVKFGIVNGLTLARIPLAAAMSLAIADKAWVTSLIYFAIISLTDIFDGKLARRWGCATRVGSLLDVVCDLAYILPSSLVLVSSGIFHPMYIWMILVKLVEFFVTSKHLAASRRVGKDLVYDKLGRYSASLFFILPGLVAMTEVMDIEGLIQPVILLTSALAALSSVQRVSACMVRSIPSEKGLLWTRSY
jgi:phosphatidylglycerophosphate synthase